MTDDRPLPEYGEYATPEQQAAAMGRAYVPPSSEPPTPEPTLPTANIARPTGYANRFFTVFLLGFGALNLFANVPGYVNLATTLKGFASASEMSLTVPASINAAGIPIVIANVVLYGLTVFLSVLAIRRGRASAYIPILGFFVFVAAVLIIISVVSPSFLTQLD
jgi:hypothetical protein